jgi:DNA invertase Pin-like site-specific DNA recombinase
LFRLEEIQKVPDKATKSGSLSGASLDRSAVQSLLADVSVGKINCVVVYKVDQLTPSQAGFAKLVKLFDRHGVSFEQVRQRPDPEADATPDRAITPMERRGADVNLERRIRSHGCNS